jgi:alpha/beta superfamily hydrolase
MVTMMPLIAGIGIVFVGISATIADPPNIVAECQGINLSTEISSSSILPARRTDIELITSDNLKLVGELALPSEVDPVATMLCLHPLTTHQGMMDSHIFRKAAWRLPALAQLAVLRFNMRGAVSARGQSQGQWDAADGEGADLRVAVEFAKSNSLPKPWVVGWSFGTDVALKHARNLDVAGLILLSPPLRWTNQKDLDAWQQSQIPITAIIPELDDYLRPEVAITRFATLPAIELIAVTGAKHLWTGEPSVYRVLTEIVAKLNPPALPLPTHFSGEMQKFSDPKG